MSLRFCNACHLPSHHPKEAAFGRPPVWIPLYGGWRGGEHSKTYRPMSKCELNLYSDAYISHIP